MTNEVGSGIVPEYPLGRLYRDYAGILNQRIAEISDQVFLVTAGIPIELKSREYLL
ncbi:Bifunctional adenosylcobalamin biosynthesis protein CobU [compost metagenome]